MIILSLFSVIQIFPLIWIINFSLKSESEIYTVSSLRLPETPMFSNYAEAWVKGNVAGYFLNSVFVTFVSVIITVALSCMMGYAITRMQWKGSGMVLTFLMLGMMIPIHATLIPLFLIMQKAGLLSSHWCIILPYIAVGLPLAVFIISNFLRSIPRELEEAAAIDGAGLYSVFFRIVFPLMKPIILTSVVLNTLNVWNDFQMSLTLLQKKAVRNVPLTQYFFFGENSIELGLAFALFILSMIPILILYLSLQKYIIGGITSGAVKG